MHIRFRLLSCAAWASALKMRVKICERELCRKKFLAKQKKQRFCCRKCAGLAGRRKRMIQFLNKAEKL